MKKQKQKIVEKHILLPKHSIASEKEKKQLMETYNATANELPKILETDAGIIGLNAKVGDIIKIERDDPWVGKKTFYRVVVQ